MLRRPRLGTPLAQCHHPPRPAFSGGELRLSPALHTHGGGGPSHRALGRRRPSSSETDTDFDPDATATSLAWLMVLEIQSEIKSKSESAQVASDHGEDDISVSPNSTRPGKMTKEHFRGAAQSLQSQVEQTAAQAAARQQEITELRAETLAAASRSAALETERAQHLSLIRMLEATHETETREALEQHGNRLEPPPPASSGPSPIAQRVSASSCNSTLPSSSRSRSRAATEAHGVKQPTRGASSGKRLLRRLSMARHVEKPKTRTNVTQGAAPQRDSAGADSDVAVQLRGRSSLSILWVFESVQ